MRRAVVLLVLACARLAGAWSLNLGYSDVAAPASTMFWAAGCNNTTAASAWDLFATNPVAVCISGTAIKKGALTFDNTNTCTSTTATTGCAFTSTVLPKDFPAAGRATVKLYFLSTATTAAQTTIWKVSTKCTTPTAGNNGVVDNPATLNAADTLTYTNGATEVGTGDGSLRTVALDPITMTGCTGGDVLHIRVGRDIADTTTNSVQFLGLEFTAYIAR